MNSSGHSAGSSRHPWPINLDNEQQRVDQDHRNGRQDLNGTQSSDNDDLSEDLLVEAADWEVSIQVQPEKTEAKEDRGNGLAGHVMKLEPAETIATSLQPPDSDVMTTEAAVKREGDSEIPQLSLSSRKQGRADSAKSNRTESPKLNSVDAKSERAASPKSPKLDYRKTRSAFRKLMGAANPTSEERNCVSDDDAEQENRSKLQSAASQRATANASPSGRSLSMDAEGEESITSGRSHRRRALNNTFKEGAKQTSSWKKVKTAINVMNMFSRSSTRDSFELSSQTGTVKESGTQTETKEMKMAEQPVEDFLQDVCTVTGWQYGEIWFRPMKKGRMHRYAQSFKAHGMKHISEGNTGFSLSNTSRRTSTGSPESPMPANTTTPRSSSCNTVVRIRYAMSGADSIPRPDKMEDKDEDDRLSNHLKFTGYHSVSKDFPDNDEMREDLGLFIRQTQDVQYDKGEGFPGLAWQRKSLDWIGLELDDELAADPRVATAKKIFAVSVGIPVLESHTGQLHAVLMMYKVREGDGGIRSNKYMHKMYKDERLRNLFYSAGSMCKPILETQEELKAWHEAMKEPEKQEEDGEHPEQQAEASEASKSMLSNFCSCCFGWMKPARVANYFKKWKGQRGTPPGKHDFSFVGWAFFGTFIAMLTVCGVDLRMTGIEYKDDTMIALIGSFGAVATMLFGVPTSPLVQPRNILGGHIIGVIVALTIDYITNERYYPIIPQWISNALVPAVSTAIMTRMGLIHPPAGACATIYISGDEKIKNLGWMFFVAPVLLDCFLMIFLSLSINNLSRTRKYPQYW